MAADCATAGLEARSGRSLRLVCGGTRQAERGGQGEGMQGLLDGGEDVGTNARIPQSSDQLKVTQPRPGQPNGAPQQWWLLLQGCALTDRLIMRLRSSSRLPTPRRRPGEAGLRASEMASFSATAGRRNQAGK